MKKVGFTELVKVGTIRVGLESIMRSGPPLADRTGCLGLLLRKEESKGKEWREGKCVHLDSERSELESLLLRAVCAFIPLS